MKVTDEMVISAYNQLTHSPDKSDVRCMLEAALKDVPGSATAEQWTAWRARAMAAEARITELEAKLPVGMASAALLHQTRHFLIEAEAKLAEIRDLVHELPFSDQQAFLAVLDKE